MTTPDLKAIEERLAAATTLCKGAEWYMHGDRLTVDHEPDWQSPTEIARIYNEPIATFIANAPADIRALLGMVREHEATIEDIAFQRDAAVSDSRYADDRAEAAEAKLAEVSGQLATVQSVRVAEEEQLAEVTRERDEARELGAAGEFLAAECTKLRRDLDTLDTENRRLHAAVRTLQDEVEAARAMVPTALELAALVNCMVWSEKSFGDCNTKSITRAWLARVEGGVSCG